MGCHIIVSTVADKRTSAVCFRQVVYCALYRMTMETVQTRIVGVSYICTLSVSCFCTVIIRFYNKRLTLISRIFRYSVLLYCLMDTAHSHVTQYNSGLKPRIDQSVFTFYCNWINPLQPKRRPLYLKIQSVPRCKHFSSGLQKPISLCCKWHKSLFVLP